MGNGSEKRPIGFFSPIALPTVLRDDLRLSPSTVGSSDWFQEWLGKEARRFSQSLFQPYSKKHPEELQNLAIFCISGHLVAHDCGYPLSRYTCRATRVAADFLDFIAFCRCSTGVALHPLKILVSHLPPPCVPGGVAPKFGSAKVSRYTVCRSYSCGCRATLCN